MCDALRVVMGRRLDIPTKFMHGFVTTHSCRVLPTTSRDIEIDLDKHFKLVYSLLVVFLIWSYLVFTYTDILNGGIWFTKRFPFIIDVQNWTWTWHESMVITVHELCRAARSAYVLQCWTDPRLIIIDCLSTKSEYHQARLSVSEILTLFVQSQLSTIYTSSSPALQS
jgi:hypothetical protein